MKKLILPILMLPVMILSMSLTEVTKNGMTVKWWYKSDRIYFELTAPTTGWVTAGINESDNTTNAYLLMGRVVKNETQVVEHYTLSAGNYKPIADLGGKSMVADIEGQESNGKTSISFSVPVNSGTKYRKNLTAGKSYFLILAYSREDDFQHHSTMRTSTKIKF